QRLGLTFVIVTHDQQEAMTVADRIAVMDRGRLIQVATPQEIYERPNSRWVADFIGDVNLIEGRVTDAGAEGIVVTSTARGQPGGCARSRPPRRNRVMPCGWHCGRRRCASRPNRRPSRGRIARPVR